MAKDRDTYSKYKKEKVLNKLFPWAGKNHKLEMEKHRYQRVQDAPMHIALIIDGVVEDIMHCDERLAMLLMSEPTVVEIDSNSPVKINWIYDEETNNFYEG